MHLLLRSSKATGSRSFLAPHRSRKIEALARTIGLKTGVEVKNFANSGNHLHMIILPKSRRAFRAFIRALSGVITRLILGLQRGRPRGKNQEEEKFWDARPFTRILEWGRSLRIAQRYLAQNVLESLRILAYQPRSRNNKLAREGPRLSRDRKTQKDTRVPRGIP